MNNSLNLVGRVSQAPKKYELGDYTKVVFSLAVKEFTSTTDENGQKVNDTIFFEVHAWNGQSQRVMDLIKKGREVAVHGRLGFNTYSPKDQPNVTRTTPIVRLNSFHLCGKKSDASSDE